MTDINLDEAVAAGALTPDAAETLRRHLEARNAAPLVDEEQFRLITGFNDIFVTIATIMLLIAVGWLGGRIAPALGAALVAATAWGLAEYFTRVRRMALPSIVLLAAFVYGVFFTALIVLFGDGHTAINGSEFATAPIALKFALAAAIAAGAAWTHWRRFTVPITVAAGVGAVTLTALGVIVALVPALRDHLLALAFVAGLATFAFAMWWDMSDRERRTRRSDVAFWLHLSAAPLIVHPVFSSLGLLGSSSFGGGAAASGDTVLKATVAIGLYVLLALVAVAIDRRALLVSALVYVLVAMASLFNSIGALNLAFALTALVVGSALLLLSALWHRARYGLVSRLSPSMQARLPVLGPAAAVRPGSAS